MLKWYLYVLITGLTLFMFTGCADITGEHADKISEETQKSDSKEINKNQNQESAESNPLTSKSPNRALMKVHYIDVGQGDSTLIQYSEDDEEFTILIDAGTYTNTNVIDYLQTQKIDEIDLAIGTHPDADHIGQLDQVLQTFDVEEVWLSGNISTSETFQDVLTEIDSKGVRYQEPRMGEEYDIGPLGIEVLYPKVITGDTNEESISLKLTYGQVRFIFTGDAAQKNEMEMVNSGTDLRAEILHLGHHGSNTSTSPGFLKAVQPEIAIYSAGKDNSYGHPHAEVVKLVQDSGIPLYGTDIDGTIIIRTDGVKYEIATRENGIITPSSIREVPKETPTTSESKETSPPTVGNRHCIDINHASMEQIQEIIHIGPERAQDLIDLRPYKTIDDLSKIKGIGDSRIEDIKFQGVACIGG